MKKLSLFFLGFFIGLLICWLIDSRSTNKEIETVVTVDTIRTVGFVPLPVPYPVKVVEPSLPELIDTSAVIYSYYTKRIYNDTLINNDRLIVSVIDTVSENSLLGRSVFYNYWYPEVTKTRTPSSRLFVGADSRGTVNVIFEKGKFLFTGGYDIANKTPVAGVGFKIFEK
jgi:hypothetical protein